MEDIIDKIKQKLEIIDGVLYWKKDPNRTPQWNARYAGKPILCVGSHGYICFNILIENKKHHMLAHRVIWAIHNNYFPKVIDHIDRNRTNNKIENLRECTQSQNNCNKKVTNRSSLKEKGIVYLGEKLNGEKRYASYIGKDKKTYYLGTFKTVSEAKEAYAKKAIELFGEYA